MALLGRGVYRAQYLSPEGLVVLFAVDHAHRRIEEAHLPETDDLVAASGMLWRMLDARDPDYARHTPEDLLIQPPAQGLGIGRLRASVALLPFCTAFALLKLAVL